jgi:hypothetical protein
MTDQQVPMPEPRDGDQEETDNPVLEEFRRKTSPAILYFLFDYWPAWMISTQRKAIAPICRILLGDDEDGSVLIDKHVHLTGLLHLADDLTSTVAFNLQRAMDLPGFVMDVPGGESHVLELIDAIEGQLKEIRSIVEKNKLFAVVEDDEHKQ